jgi:glycosyltransferase involved in cell wall biosynthesis
MAAANPVLEITTILSWVLAVLWLVHAIIVARGMATLPDVTPGVTDDGVSDLFATDEDQITVIVPARDEEASIENTLHSLLQSTGVRLQIIAVNDRSTDGTGIRMDDVAAEAATASGGHTLRVTHVSELPAGWLGKPYAMASASRLARSPWLLFTDGDVLFHPRAIEIALHEAEARGADHLVLAPTVILKNVAEKAMLATMNMMSQGMVRLWKVSDPRSKDFIGVGGFNLIRREVYEKLGGFDALRMEVLDDLRLGWLVKRAGYRQCAIVGRDLVRLRWLHSPLGVIRLAEKNGFAVHRYRVGLTLLASLGLLALAVLPLVAIAAGGLSLAAGLLAYFAVALTFWGNRKVTPAPPWLAVLYAPATLVVLYALLRSMTLALIRQGINWRGTRYSLKELRRNAGRSWRF